MSLLGKNKDKGGKPKLKDKHMKSKGNFFFQMNEAQNLMLRIKGQQLG